MAEPSIYDLVQDSKISGLEDIVTPSYTPPEGQEYSFPVVGQGISSQQFQLISRAAGTGVYVQHDEETADAPYRLTGMPGGDSETNAKNQMMLRTSSSNGRSEAAIEGFFHTQLYDIPIDLPAVSTPTTYRICLTLDPRKEGNPEGPVSIEVYTDTPPRTFNRKHIVLWTVARQPNQLLTQATITRTKPWLGHVINVWSYSDLPDPTTVEYGTLAVIAIPSSDRSVPPALYTNRGVHGWRPILDDQPFGVTLVNGWEHYENFGELKGRISRGRVFLQGAIRRGIWSSGRNIARVIPPAARPSRTCFLQVQHSRMNEITPDIRITDGGEIYISDSRGGGTPSWVSFDGVSYPLY